ncbi:MAG TPA: GvpL/GvpF family gas vesicle protein [Thermoleophilaceae bacterium]
MALVVYGVMRAADCPGGFSVDWRKQTVDVCAVEHEGVCALTGEAPDGAVRLRRDALLAHSEVLNAAMEHGPVLPLRFGVAMPDENAVRDELLAPNAGSLAGRLDALAGTAEFQLKVTFVTDRVLPSIVAADSQLADIAARLRSLPGAAGHFDRIRLGELIGQHVDGRAAAIEAEVVDALAPLAMAVAHGERQHEWMALNIAFLVADAQRNGFDAAIDRLNEGYGGDLQFKLIGPLPPHSFAEHAWEAGAAWV